MIIVWVLAAVGGLLVWALLCYALPMICGNMVGLVESHLLCYSALLAHC